MHSEVGPYILRPECSGCLVVFVDGLLWGLVLSMSSFKHHVPPIKPGKVFMIYKIADI